MQDYDQDSETSPAEVKPRPRRHRRKRNPQNTHDYLQKVNDGEGVIANQGAISQSKSLDHSSNDNIATGGKAEKRSQYVNKRLTKLSITSEEIDLSERRRPRRKTKSGHRVPRALSEEALNAEASPESPSFNASTENLQIEIVRIRADRTNDNPERANRRAPRKSNHRDNHEKKRRSRNTPHLFGKEDNYHGDEEYSEVYPVDNEDIVHKSDISIGHAKVAATHIMPPLPSQPSDVVYVEKKGGQGFIKEHKSNVGKVPQLPAQLSHKTGKYTTLEFVLKMHFGLRTFSMIIHGLLAGIALAQCIFVYSLSNQGDTVLLDHYYNLALPFQSLYYLLLAISTVSIFDRCIIIGSGWNQFFTSLIRRPSRALALISYLFALIFSVSLAQLDDRISMSKVMPELWRNKSLQTWKVINLLRVIGSITGWVVVALSPNDDLTAESIQEKIQNEKEHGNGTTRTTNSASWDRINL